METTYTFLNAIQDCGINDGTCLVGVTPRNGASLHKVREFAGHANICTTELYFVRKEEDAEGRGTTDPDPCDGAERRVSPFHIFNRLKHHYTFSGRYAKPPK